MVAQSGYKDEVGRINVTPTAPLDDAAAVIIQSMLKAVGINAQINTVELAAWIQTWRTGNFDLFVNDLTMRPDPIAIYRPLWNSDSALIDQIHELQVKDLPFMPLFYSTIGQGYRDTVHGYEVWAAGYVRVWNVWTAR